MSRECRSCGSHVTERFARVFTGNGAEVHACPECENFSALVDGAAARPHPEP